MWLKDYVITILIRARGVIERAAKLTEICGLIYSYKPLANVPSETENMTLKDLGIILQLSACYCMEGEKMRKQSQNGEKWKRMIYIHKHVFLRKMLLLNK